MRSMQLIKHILITTLLISSWSTSAALIQRDYIEKDDGGITYDDVSGYEWLDLTYTRTLSFDKYQEVLARTTEGWMFADTEQVTALFEQFSLTDEVNENYGTPTAYDNGFQYYKPLKTELINIVDKMAILGETLSIGSQGEKIEFYGLRGYFNNKSQDDELSTVEDSATHQYAAYYKKNQTSAVLSLGNFIGVPEGSRYESFFTYRLAQAENNFDDPNVRTSNVDFPAIPVSEPATFGMFAMMLSILVYRRTKR